jgi:hypothetical protein
MLDTNSENTLSFMILVCPGLPATFWDPTTYRHRGFKHELVYKFLIKLCRHQLREQLLFLVLLSQVIGLVLGIHAGPKYVLV